MKVKELYKKYKNDYDILLFGVPLNIPSTPFTRLPKDKSLNECEVLDLVIDDKAVSGFEYNINGTFVKKYNYKGTIYAYVG